MYLKKISEEIIRRYEAGDPDGDSTLEQREVQLLVCQIINRLLKAEHLQTHLPLGESVPPHALIATYDVTPEVVSGSDKIFECTALEQPFPGEYWTTPDGSYWTDDEGNYWVVSGHEVTLSITLQSGRIYEVQISGATPPQGISFAQIIEFMNVTTPGYIKFTGVVGTEIMVFDISGMTDFVAASDGFTFTYDLDAVAASDEQIQQAVQSTHLAFPSSTGDTTIEIINIEKCLLTTININPSQSKITLPAQPINLPRGMGVWKLFSRNDPWNSYIPIQSGNYFMYSPNLQNSFNTLTVYEYHDNKTLLLNKGIDQLPENLQLQLLVVDPEQIGPFDLLPIPADMEDQVIVEALQILQPQRPADALQDDNPDIR